MFYGRVWCWDGMTTIYVKKPKDTLLKIYAERGERKLMKNKTDCKNLK